MGSEAGRPISLGSAVPWVWLCLGITALGVIEVAVGALVVRALLDAPWSRLVEVLLAVGTLAVLVVLWSPLAGRLRITPERLDVGFGLLGALHVELAAIEEVREFHPEALRPVPVGIEVDDGASVASFSRGGAPGFVLVRAASPQPVRQQVLRRSSIRTAIIAVDDAGFVAGQLRAALQGRDHRG